MVKYKGVELRIFEKNITEVKTEAVVNAANNTLLGGSGVDGSIHKVGGTVIMEQCKKIGGCPTGEAKITTAGKLPSNYVIHTVGPIYKDGKSNEAKLLYNAYYNSLKLAKEYNIKRIAFPSISTGAYGYPIEKAVKIAMNAIRDFIDLEKHVLEIDFILFNQKDYKIYKDYLLKFFKKTIY